MKRFVSALLALGLMLALAAPAQATITASPNSLAFEAQQDGPSEAKPVKVEVTEDEEAWKVSSLQFVGAGSVVAAYSTESLCLVTLEGKGERSCTIFVRFDPQKVPGKSGNFPATLWISLETLDRENIKQLPVDLIGKIAPTESASGGSSGGETRREKERRRKEKEQAREEKRSKGRSAKKKANKNRCVPKKKGKRKGKAGKRKAGKSQAHASAKPKAKQKGKRKGKRNGCAPKKAKKKGKRAQKGKSSPKRASAA